jgi:transcriptional regulator with XRE-family HTH domain
MIALNFDTPQDIALRLARQFKERRLSLNMTQKTVAERSGVSLAVLKQFERTGKISLLSLLKLVIPIGGLKGLEISLFENIASLDELMRQAKTRQRARQ